MLPLIAVLAFQVDWRSMWAVADLNDLKQPRSIYGRVASDTLAAELAKSRAYEIVPRERIGEAVVALGIHSPPSSLVDLSRVGQKVQASVIVSGEVVDYRIDPGGPAWAAVRVVAYDVAGGIPFDGALEVGRADLHDSGREAVVREAIGRAVVQAVATMRSRKVPTARILSTVGRGTFVIDRGAWVGFRKGMRVFVTAGSSVIGLGRVEEVEESRAVIVPVERALGWTPGRRVRAIFEPPPLSSPGTAYLHVMSRASLPSCHVRLE